MEKNSKAKWVLSCVQVGLLAVFVSASGRGAIVAGIGQNFTASTLRVDSFSLPPDSNGAAGPTNFVEFINGRYSVYNKTNGVRLQTFTDVGFWSGAGISIPSGWSVSDPRLVYDPTVQRWFAAAIDFDPTFTINTNRFLLAISASPDPTGVWKGVAIPTDPGGSNFGDFPTLGLDAQGVYLAANLFNTNGSMTADSLLSIPKADLLTATPSTARRTWFGELGYPARGQIIQPVICVDGTISGKVLAAGSLGLDFVSHITLVGSSISNPGGNPATLSSGTAITVPSYAVPINPTQPDHTTDLDDGDSRFSATVWAVNGVLYAVHSTEVNNRAAVRWYRLSAGNFALLESGTITDPVLDLFYPSIAANSNGTVVIGYNGCSSGSFVSCYAVVGETRNNVTTFGSRLLLKAGVASYQDGNSVSRWGDYSATTVDPADPTRFWTIQMFPASGSTWATQVTEIRTAQVNLRIARSGGNVILSWPAVANGFQLQSVSSLPANNAWAPVGQTPVANGDTLSVTLPANAAPQYFRLQAM
jgi:hypothetical protein